MGKYTELKIAGYVLYYTMKCLNEGIIHVHANPQRMTEDSVAKLWVYKDGTSELAKPTNIKTADLREIQKWICDNIDLIQAEWLSNGVGGDFKKK